MVIMLMSMFAMCAFAIGFVIISLYEVFTKHYVSNKVIKIDFAMLVISATLFIISIAYQIITF